MVDYIPERGDLVWMNFNPQLGKEQSGHRPAVVISPKAFNSLSSLAFVCPITSKVKGFSFEVKLRGTKTIKGVILVHHLRSIDWKSRKLSFAEKVHQEVMDEVSNKLDPLIHINPVER